jgi:Heliorhodopsin
MTDVHAVSSPALEARSAAGLRRLNVVVGCAHAIQAIALLMLAGEASLPVTASFLAGPPGAGDYGSAGLGSLRVEIGPKPRLFCPIPAEMGRNQRKMRAADRMSAAPKSL